MGNGFWKGIDIALKMKGIKDSEERNAIINKLYQTQLQQTEQKMNLSNTPISKFMKPETQPSIMPGDELGLSRDMLAPTVDQLPTGRNVFTMPENATLGEMEYLSKAKALLSPQQELQGFSPGSVVLNKRTGEKVFEVPDKPTEPKGSNYKVIQDKTSSTGWSYQDVTNPGDIMQNAPPPLSTTITPYQQESLDVRREQGEENRALRQQMHEDNLSLRRELLELQKTRVNRLPPSVVKEVNDKAEALDRYVSLMDSFKDEYAGSLIGGPTATRIYERLGTNKGRVDWWKNWLLLDSKVRHELFGATLTSNEQIAWDKITINENTSPEIARQAMQTRMKIAKSALDREIQGYADAGYGNTEQFEKKDKFGFKLGETRQAKDGKTYTYIGNNQWEQ